MKTKFTIATFFVHVVLGFSQVDFDPFDLPPTVLKKGKVKSITEYDSKENKTQYAGYDTIGNEVFYQSEGRIIKSDIDYNEKGEIQNEQASGFEQETLLEKRILHSKSDGKIVAIYYTIPIYMLTTGFIERYTYNEMGMVDQISVSTLDKDKPIFLHKYSYGNTNKLELINSFVIDYAKDTLNLFTKEFKYYEDGVLKSMLQIASTGDTIVELNYNKTGLLEQEIISYFYVTPHQYIYDTEIYLGFLEKEETPLNTYILMHNIYQEEMHYELPSVYLYHTYEDGKLVSTVKKVNSTNLLETVQYVYDSKDGLSRQIKINYQGDTTVYQYDNTLLEDGSIESVVNLLQHPNAQMIITCNSVPSGNNSELKIELLKRRWQCKTIWEFDKTTNCVVKKQFDMDISTGLYPSTPGKTITVFFDQNGRQIRSETWVDYGDEIAPETEDDVDINQMEVLRSYYTPNGLLEKYEITGWYGSQYWRYQYDPVSSRVLKLELFKDSLYAVPLSYYKYDYDRTGNYSVQRIKIEDETGNINPGRIQYFDSAGKLVKEVSYPSALYDDEQESLGPMFTVTYIYNEQGFCVEIISEEEDMKEGMRYEYEFY